ncbi:hypothetical protein QJS10_CPA08g01008 [Acorus calamus]|uniref:Uncharacterized protein n=1 Tax=Acorus calamus TaxID=4465 RepID=A0AAV9E9D4_ACOCL|nr:hypothetical protein QJS10_CPA08g01008 [Acorus calamus]
MNSYYQISGLNDFDCDFAKTGLITTVDPKKNKYTISFQNKGEAEEMVMRGNKGKKNKEELNGA